jgi:hypothetical protein
MHLKDSSSRVTGFVTPSIVISPSAPARSSPLKRSFYEVDPLECPKCKGPMRVIALIEDPGVIRRILEHLKLWAPLATERSPPRAAASWPRHANLPLTYQRIDGAEVGNRRQEAERAGVEVTEYRRT